MTFDRKSWLANLKEGDEVCVDTTVIGGDNHQKITTITKITSTHKFKVDKDLFNEYGERKINWTRSTLIPSTPEVKQGIRDRNRRYYVKNIDYSQLSQESIDEIYVLLKRGETAKMRELHLCKHTEMI